MHTNNKRRSREVEKTAERLYYKFLASYVEVKHNDIHKEALALFNKAKHENPCVKDLMKTATYLKTTHPDKPIPRHYTRRKQNHPLPPQTKQMVLNIQMLPARPTTCSSQSEVTSSPLPPRSEVSIQPEVATLPLPPPEVTTQPEISTLPVLPPEIYNDLLRELREDPELWRILNEFEDNTMDSLVADDIFGTEELTPLDLHEFEDNTMDSLVADDIFGTEELTPLEKELETPFDN